MKIDLRFWNVWTLVLIFGVAYLPGNVLAENEEIPFHRTTTAIRISGPPPRLDGVLDDEIWKIAPLHEGFRQRDPDEGKPATERTTFQIAYDDEALYFGIMCYDNEPDKIVAQLVRRDNVFVDSDKVNINLDPHHNRQSAYWFTVHPSGSVTDGIISDNKQPDRTWDGVWDAKTQIHADGWAVEYKIPFHILRFSPVVLNRRQFSVPLKSSVERKAVPLSASWRQLLHQSMHKLKKQASPHGLRKQVTAANISLNP